MLDLDQMLSRYGEYLKPGEESAPLLPEGISETWRERLPQWIEENRPNRPKKTEEIENEKKEYIDEFNSNLEKHLKHKDHGTVIMYLPIITAALDDQIPSVRLNENDKEAIRLKITMNITWCTGGFIDRLEESIVSLEQPSTLDGLLALFRKQIVERASHPFCEQEDKIKGNDSQSIHLRQQFFEIAQEEKFSLPLVKPGADYYAAKKLNSEIVKEAIQTQINKDYTPGKIVSSLWTTVFHTYGYVGRKEAIKPDESYPSGVYLPIIKYIRDILDNQSLPYPDLLTFATSGAVGDINWLNLNTLLIDFLEGQGYLRSAADAKPNTENYKSDKKSASLTVEYFPNELFNAKLIYNDSEVGTVKCFMDSEPAHVQTLIQQVPVEIINSFIEAHADELNPAIISRLLAGVDPKNYENISNLKERLESTINTPNDIETILKPLSKEQCTEVCKRIAELLPKLINNAETFNNVLKNLKSDQRTVLYEAFIDKLSRFIDADVGHFGKVLQYLTPEQCDAVCKQTKEQSLNIVTNASKFNNLLQNLNSKQRTVVYEAFEASLPNLIGKNAEDFNKVLQFLDASQRSEVFATVKINIINITNTTEFKQVLQYLNADQRTIVFDEKTADWLADNISNTFQLMEVLLYLSPEQCTVVCAQLPNLINSADNFNDVLQNLKPDQRTALYEVFKDGLPGLIEENVGRLGKVLQYLTPEQCAAVCEQTKEQSLNIVTNAGEFNQLLKDLNREQRTAVYQAFKDSLPSLINENAEAFNKALQYLDTDQRSDVFAAVKINITNTTKFNQVLQYLDADQRTIVFEEKMEAGLAYNILNKADLHNVLRYLSPEQCTRVCNEKIENLHKLITNSEDMIEVLLTLSPEQCKVVCGAMLAWLPLTIIKSKFDCMFILPHLSPEQCAEVCDELENNDYMLRSIINTANDFKDVLRPLNSEQRTVVYNVLIDWLPVILTSASGLNSLLLHLSPTQCGDVCRAIDDITLRNIIGDISAFKKVLQGLNPEQRTAVSSAMIETLPVIFDNIIGNISDLNYILLKLSPQDCETVCKGMEYRLPTLINNFNEYRNATFGLSFDQRIAINPSIINNIETLKDVLVAEHTPEQCKIVCESMETQQLNKLIKSSWDLGYILDALDAKKGEAVHDSLNAILPKSTTDLNWDYTEAIQQDLQDSFAKIVEETDVETVLSNIEIENVNYFRHVLKHILVEQSETFCKAVKPKLLTLIKDVQDFNEAVEGFEPDKVTAIYDVMKDTLNDMILNDDQLGDACKHLGTLEQLQVCVSYSQKKYKTHYDTNTSWRYSLFHGEGGQQRAVTCKENINSAIEINAAKKILQTFEGPVRDESFLTFLLQNIVKIAPLKEALNMGGITEINLSNPEGRKDALKIIKSLTQAPPTGQPLTPT